MSVQTSSDPISIRGRYLWRGDCRFFVRGVVYQPRDTDDPISDDYLPQLKHDILLFKELELNTLFVYRIDHTKTHVQAMKLLEQAGLYVFITVATPSCCINRVSPYESYNPTTITSYFRAVDIMASHPNTLGLIAANELVNNNATMSVTPVIRAVVRDLKRYMKLKYQVTGQRVLPIGYNAATTEARDKTVLNYLSSGDEQGSIDFWTCNNYAWAGESTLVQSGYDILIDQLRHTGIPMFFAEYGTNLHQPRTFQETIALYSPRMSEVFSGGCVYEMWQGSNEYGLVELLGNMEDKKSAAYRRARVRANNANKVVEKRQTERGLLLVYHDFTNYKANLAAVRNEEVSWDRGFTGGEVATRAIINPTQVSWPWEPESYEPETCLDWERMEALVEHEVDTS